MKSVIDTLDAVPEGLRSEYEPKDGKFVLKLEGDHPVVTSTITSVTENANRKIGEFRDNNVQLLKAIGAESFEDAKRKLDVLRSVDPEEAKRLKAKLEEFEKAGGVKDPADITKLVARELELHVTPLKAQLAELTEREKAAKASVARKTLENALQNAGMKAGVDEKAMTDFVHRGAGVFKSDENGNITAVRADGTPIFSKRRAGEQITPDEWALDLAAEAPHLFKPSHGGGANGGAKSGADVKFVDGRSALEFGKNLEAIASGKAQVTQ